jgi:Na+:H+ antiporter, NhaA family
VRLSIDLSQPGAGRVLLGVVLGLALGKPLGVTLASWLAIKTRLGAAPDGVTLRQFIGAAFLCGVGDTVALLIADRAFPAGEAASIAKIGVLIGSVVAGVVGALVLASGPRAAAQSRT